MLRRTLLVGSIGALLVGCGGGSSGGSSAPPAGTAEGLWFGTTDDSRAVTGIVLDTGVYWFIYSIVGNSSVVGGVVQGQGSSSNGEFTSSNARDFNFEGFGITNATVQGNYEQKTSFDGTITYPAGAGIFNLNYDSDYEQTPSLADLAGNYEGWAVTEDGLDTAAVTISAGGSVTGLSNLGCSFSGTVTIHGAGNVYDISVTFGGGTCSNGTSTVTGIAYLDTASGDFYSAALNSGRTNGFLYVGTKL